MQHRAPGAVRMTCAKPLFSFGDHPGWLQDDTLKRQRRQQQRTDLITVPDACRALLGSDQHIAERCLLKRKVPMTYGPKRVWSNSETEELRDTVRLPCIVL